MHQSAAHAAARGLAIVVACGVAFGAVLVLGLAVAGAPATPARQPSVGPALAGPPLLISHVKGWYKLGQDARKYGGGDSVGETIGWHQADPLFASEVVIGDGEYVLVGPGGSCTDPITGVKHTHEGERCVTP